MDPGTKSKRPVVSGYVPKDVLADLLDGNSEPMAPEIAGERAARRINRALREREKGESKTADEA